MTGTAAADSTAQTINGHATLFSEAAESYVRFRPPYPDEVFVHLIGQLHLTPASRLADLGCGPGTLAIPLSDHAGAVVAVDPNQEMLDLGKAQVGGRRNITWLRGRAEQIAELADGQFEHAVFGRSFHWTDRVSMLQTLDRMLLAGGAVVLVGQSRTTEGRSRRPWDDAVTPVREAFLGPDKDSMHARLRNRKPSHVEILATSAFSNIHRRLFAVNRSLDLESAVGQQLSYSYSTAALFGERVEEFVQAARAAIIDACGPGPYTSHETTEVIIARRPNQPVGPTDPAAMNEPAASI